METSYYLIWIPNELEETELNTANKMEARKKIKLNYGKAETPESLSGVSYGEFYMMYMRPVNVTNSISNILGTYWTEVNW